MDFSQYFRGKKITVMGLGLLGRGVGDAAFLAECGADLIVTDLKTDEQLAGSVNKLREYSNIRFTLGEHKEEDFEGRDLILVAAGVPMDTPYLTHALKSGARLAQSAALFAELSLIPMVGVTGTRGKSTVTAMIHHILETITGEPVIKGGNVRGVSNLQLLKEVKEDSLAVFELDSWQLQGFGWAKRSPQVAVFTNFMDDHLNYYKDDRTAYFADKANIFLYQEESGVLITTPAVFERAKDFAKGKNITLGQEVVLVDESIIPEDAVLAMPGEHNRLNAALAVAACRTTGLEDEAIFEALASFPGVEGRLQFVGEHEGVKIYNDNNATSPQATVAALQSLGEVGQIVLIAGGADKTIALDELVETIPKYCKKVILLPGTGSEQLAGLISPDSVIKTESLVKAVEAGIQNSESGDILLFSPGFASFGLFTNEYDRNDQFMSLINQYVS